jgi:hypothetical protein
MPRTLVRLEGKSLKVPSQVAHCENGAQTASVNKSRRPTIMLRDGGS